MPLPAALAKIQTVVKAKPELAFAGVGATFALASRARKKKTADANPALGPAATTSVMDGSVGGLASLLSDSQGRNADLFGQLFALIGAGGGGIDTPGTSGSTLPTSATVSPLSDAVVSSSPVNVSALLADTGSITRISAPLPPAPVSALMPSARSVATAQSLSTPSLVRPAGALSWSQTGRTLASTPDALDAANISYAAVASGAPIPPPPIVRGVTEIISSRNGTNPLAPQAINLGAPVLSTLSAVNGELTNAAVTRTFLNFSANDTGAVVATPVQIPYTPVPVTVTPQATTWAPAAYNPASYQQIEPGVADSRQFYTTPSENAPAGYDWNAHNAARAAGLTVE
jgi:hypothetical protein